MERYPVSGIVDAQAEEFVGRLHRRAVLPRLDLLVEHAHAPAMQVGLREGIKPHGPLYRREVVVQANVGLHRIGDS